MAADPASFERPRETMDAQQLRERLQVVSSELKRTQEEIQQDAASLERLRAMLDVNYWNELTGIVNTLEARAREAVEVAQAAEAANQELRRRLDQEAGRLEKLWDAFKAQETELKATQDKAGRLERELRDKDATRATLAAEVEDRDARLRRMTDERDHLLGRVDEMEGRIESLRDVEALKASATDFRSRYEAERDRLAKLYALYEESESDRSRLREELETAEEWFTENRECLEKISRSLRWRAEMLKRREGAPGGA